ncbi:cytochrome P450 716B1 [Cucumis sativus]|uniref:Cytochrome P450 n=1 Tax=Cucumis sativus TaxID=3659 RepID=A0A0A0LA02_CUCSA|nr:cytochrome P450 716B1 [Cucumis sativus]KGN57442.1 hypothetical protein Csa_010272 [Cucumis sativus]
MIIYLTIFFCLLIPIFLFLRRSSKKRQLPPGSLGFPLIGQSLSLLRAMRTNTAEQWAQQRIRNYGAISKLTLFGKPTVFIGGQSGNKLIFSGDCAVVSNQQNESLRAILGERNLLELIGEDHKRVRNALVSFLKPECLKEYVGKMDEEIRSHIRMHWHCKQEVTVLPLMKTLTFNIVCSLLFGLEQGTRRERMIECFRVMISGVWSIPINLPFTRYNQSRRASRKIQEMLKELLDEKRVELEEKGGSSHQDLITCLLSIRNEENELVLSEKEIVHNIMLVLVAGFDTSSVLITFMMRNLANNPTVYAAVLQEQEEIARSKKCGELLNWEDLAKMKYTWRVALETLRLVAPIFGGFRKAMNDIQFGGYLIPKGWQIFWTSPVTHLDDTIFREPSKFDPDRFKNPASIPPYCFLGFGSGPRICPGNEFARVETLVTIHYLITQFTWKLLLDDHFIRDPMPTPTKGMPIKIWPRSQSFMAV